MLELRAVVLKTGRRPVTHLFQRGSISVVLGRNHSGKTRLTRVIAGLDAPESGDVVLGGESLGGVAPGQRPVALVYQAFVNYPNWTVFDNLASPLKAQRVSRESLQRQVRDIADKLQLTPLLDRYPHALSGGQQQRVAIGRALAKSAEVLVMDEPLVNLDYKLREALQLELRSLLRDLGLTVIYTTSDPRDAFALGDDLILLGDHELLQTGAPLAVYRNPQSSAAADLMSDPRTNRWQRDDRQILIRPEHLYSEQTRDDDLSFDVEVLATETNGSETFLHCRLPAGGTEDHWVARLDGLQTLRPGSIHRLYTPVAALLHCDGVDGGSVARESALHG